MNNLENLMDKYPSLSYKFQTMPKGLPGLTTGNSILIDKNKTSTIQNEILAEEIAHYETTVGNIIDQSVIENRKQESSARRRACILLVDLDSLTACYDIGIDTPEDLADYFDVSIEFLWKTIDTYRVKNGLYFEYKGYIFDLRTGLNISKKSDVR